jgi:hypothetical protein
LIRFGTQGVRAINSNYWLDLANSKSDADLLVLSDVRFVNEIDYFRGKGRVIHIILYRDESELLINSNLHPSKWEYLQRADKAILLHNNGTIRELEQKIAKIISRLHPL